VHVALPACVRIPLETFLRKCGVECVLCVLTEAVGRWDMCSRRKQGEKTSLDVHSSAETTLAFVPEHCK